jgi:hypothetical protein
LNYNILTIQCITHIFNEQYEQVDPYQYLAIHGLTYFCWFDILAVYWMSTPLQAQVQTEGSKIQVSFERNH